MEATVNKALPILGEIRTITEEQREQRYHEFTLSTESVDRHGTVFRSEGWDIESYNNSNPIVSYVHRDNDPDPDLIIGRGKVFKEGKDLIGRIYYEPEDINPLAEKIRKKVDHGTIRMASILAQPKKGHFGKEEDGEKRDVLYFDSQELMSWSIVPLGSNRDALKRTADAIEDIKASIKTEVPNYIEGGLIEGQQMLTRNIEVNDAETIETNQESKKLLAIREAQLKINKSYE